MSLLFAGRDLRLKGQALKSCRRRVQGLWFRVEGVSFNIYISRVNRK